MNDSITTPSGYVTRVANTRGGRCGAIALVAGVGLLAVAAAGCGTGSSPTAVSPAPTPTAPAASSTEVLLTMPTTTSTSTLPATTTTVAGPEVLELAPVTIPGVPIPAEYVESLAAASGVPVDPVAALASVAAPGHTPIISNGQVVSVDVNGSGYSTRTRTVWLVGGGDDSSTETLFNQLQTALVPSGFTGEAAVTVQDGVTIRYGSWDAPFDVLHELRAVEITAYPLSSLGMTAVEIGYDAATSDPATFEPAPVTIPAQIVAADTFGDLAFAAGAEPTEWMMHTGFTSFGLTLEQEGSFSWSASFEAVVTDPAAMVAAVCPVPPTVGASYAQCYADLGVSAPNVQVAVTPTADGLSAIRVLSRLYA